MILSAACTASQWVAIQTHDTLAPADLISDGPCLDQHLRTHSVWFGASDSTSTMSFPSSQSSVVRELDNGAVLKLVFLGMLFLECLCWLWGVASWAAGTRMCVDLFFCSHGHTLALPVWPSKPWRGLGEQEPPYPMDTILGPDQHFIEAVLCPLLDTRSSSPAQLCGLYSCFLGFYTVSEQCL